MESYITLSFLNDFIFCPRSIYFHQLYSPFNDEFYKATPQILGKEVHEAIDKSRYSTRNDILMATEIYTSKYNIAGKIDVFNITTGQLTERKREIKTIYDGFVFQVYAQYFGLEELGYQVNSIIIHDSIHNKNYPIPLPTQDLVMFKKFEELIKEINSYRLDDEKLIPNPEKCKNCIYSNLCDKSLC